MGLFAEAQGQCDFDLADFRMPEDELAEVGNVPTEGWIPLATA